MALGNRDILLTVRARDEASATLNKIGQSTRQFGLAADSASFKMFGFGIAAQKIGQALYGYGQMVLKATVATGTMALQFDQQMAQVQTQAQLTGKQFEILTDKTLELAGRVPQPFADITKGLYDIFSSTDASMQDALFMVEKFSQAAVAGGTSIETAGKGAIAIMNAFGMTAQDLTQILDVQFQMVRLGVGTYEEFASAFGNVVPSARAAGQTLETTAGAVAFMSRQGFTASQAAISVARALDQLFKPDNAADLKKVLGVDVIDH